MTNKKINRKEHNNNTQHLCYMDLAERVPYPCRLGYDTDTDMGYVPDVVYSLPDVDHQKNLGF